jgi:ATP adenylyltransferase
VQQLWAPWRLEYVAGASSADPDDRCIFCATPEDGDDDRALIVHRGERCFVILNLYPYSNGHLMVAPYRHVAAPGELDAAERAELWELMAHSIAALDRAMAPQGYNAGLNLGRVAGAGVEGHIHMHVVPRGNGDTNFMPVLADVKVIPEHLLETRDRLRDAWPR